MSASNFDFVKKPFFANPDPDCFVPLTAHAQACDALEEWVYDGEGIALVTAAAGLGKTLLCERVAQRLEEDFVTVFLPHSDYPTVRQLLQTILFQLQRPYAKLDDHELRLEISETLRQIERGGKRVVLVIDEAHELSEEMVRELKAVTALADTDAQGMLLLLCGQLELEELLGRRSLSALNQRVKLHLVLESLTREESAEYLAARLEWAGADIETVMDEEAVALITHLCDGVPRCLNILAEESIKFAAFADAETVTEAHVRECFEQVRHLPLHWNELPGEPSLGESGSSPVDATAETEAADFGDDSHSETSDSGTLSAAEAHRSEPVDYVVAEFGAGIDDDAPVVDLTQPQAAPAAGIPVARPTPYVPKPISADDEFGQGLQQVFTHETPASAPMAEVEDLIGQMIESRPLSSARRQSFRADPPHSRANPIDIFAPEVADLPAPETTPVADIEPEQEPVLELESIPEPDSIVVELEVEEEVALVDESVLIDEPTSVEELDETVVLANRAVFPEPVVADPEPAEDLAAQIAEVVEAPVESSADTPEWDAVSLESEPAPPEYDVIQPRDRFASPVSETISTASGLNLQLHLPLAGRPQRYRNLFRQLRRRLDRSDN